MKENHKNRRILEKKYQKLIETQKEMDENEKRLRDERCKWRNHPRYIRDKFCARFERKRAVLEDREWNLEEDIIDQCDILGIDADFVFKQGLPKVIEMEIEENGSK